MSLQVCDLLMFTSNALNNFKVLNNIQWANKGYEMVPVPRGEKQSGQASQHKAQLSRLKSKDPEFYKFLEENDRTLLNFDDTDSSDDEDDEDGKYHIPPSHLEVYLVLFIFSILDLLAVIYHY